MRSFKNREFQDLDGLKKGIRCFFISNGSPKSFLIIQLRVVGRKIMKMQLTMFPTKNLHPLSPVPSSSIHPKVDGFLLETERNSFENPQKASRVALRPFHHSHAVRQPELPIQRDSAAFDAGSGYRQERLLGQGSIGNAVARRIPSPAGSIPPGPLVRDLCLRS